MEGVTAGKVINIQMEIFEDDDKIVSSQAHVGEQKF